MLLVDGTEEPRFQKTLDCHSDLRNLGGRPRQRTSLDDEFFYGVAIFDLADVSWIHWERSLTYFEIAP